MSAELSSVTLCRYRQLRVAIAELAMAAAGAAMAYETEGARSELECVRLERVVRAGLQVALQAAELEGCGELPISDEDRWAQHLCALSRMADVVVEGRLPIGPSDAMAYTARLLLESALEELLVPRGGDDA